MNRELFSKADEESIAIVKREVGMLKKLDAIHDALMAQHKLDASTYPTRNISQIFQFPLDLLLMLMAVSPRPGQLMARA